MSDTNTFYTLTLVRHGESMGNANGVWQGQADFELTETGKSQAAALAQHWQQEGKSFDLAITSPLKRARQTAEIIAARLQVPLETDADWMEWDIGEYSGLNDATIDERFGRRQKFSHPMLPVGKIGESKWMLMGRAARALQTVTSRQPGQYLIVAHGAVLNLALMVCLGISLPPNDGGAHFRFFNTSVAELTYDPGRYRWTLEKLNDQRHLESLSKTERV